MRKITDWSVSDLGIKHSQYFQGYGTLGSGYENACYGVGDTPREALDDCLDQIAGAYDVDADDLERRILDTYPDFADDAKNEADSVESYLREKNPGEWVGDDGEMDWNGCELYYHIGIRWN